MYDFLTFDLGFQISDFFFHHEEHEGHEEKIKMKINFHRDVWDECKDYLKERRKCFT